MMFIYLPDVLQTLEAAAVSAYFDLAIGDGRDGQHKGPTCFSGYVRKYLPIRVARFTIRLGEARDRSHQAAPPDPPFQSGPYFEARSVPSRGGSDQDFRASGDRGALG